ncbi:MAG: SGNH/GDSL hydrolase family protein [Alphaproteobacteria bacterium]
MKVGSLVSLCLAAWGGYPLAAAEGGKDRCVFPDELRSANFPLPGLKKRLQQTSQIVVLVLGSSSSMTGQPARNPRSYVQDLDLALQAAFPGKTFVLKNLSKRMQSAAEMAQRLPADVISGRPDLVIWQTGTVEAARHVDTNSFTDALIQGLEALRRAGIDVILVGPQTHNRLATMIDVESYNDVLGQIADRESASFLSRFDIMRYWEESGTFVLGSQDKGAQMREAGAQSQCITQILVEQIRRAVTETQ